VVAHEIPDLEYMHELILVMSVGKGVFCKQMNNYEWVGGYFIFIYLYVHSSPYLFVYGDDRVTCYPGADDVSSGPRDA